MTRPPTTPAPTSEAPTRMPPRGRAGARPRRECRCRTKATGARLAMARPARATGRSAAWLPPVERTGARRARRPNWCHRAATRSWQTRDRTTASRPRARPPPACSRAPRRSAARSPPFPPSQWTYPSTEEGGASSSHGECARPQLCVARARLFDSRRTVDAMRTAPVQYYCISSPRLLHARHLSGGVVWWAPAVAPLCPDAGC
mmetsp:Transcript_24061/g.77668  ORF Transcript_24061/g.77668 Transcript_24061/m.77668 type:complete len:203 (-) Transcript_24061:245-853(-)